MVISRHFSYSPCSSQLIAVVHSWSSLHKIGNWILSSRKQPWLYIRIPGELFLKNKNLNAQAHLQRFCKDLNDVG